MSLTYLEAQPDADLLKQILGLLPTRRGRAKGGRPKGPAPNPKRREAEHGTYYFYKTRKCRCDPCRWANNEQQRAYYERKRARERDRV